MLRKYLSVSVLTIATMVMVGGMSMVTSAYACSGTNCITEGASSAGGTNASPDSLPNLVQTITSVLLYAIGAVSVIMLVIGGFKYVTSNGNAESIKSAKNTILYAIIGIAVAVSAYAIVSWVIKQF